MKVLGNDGVDLFNGYNNNVALNVNLYRPESRPNDIPWVKILYADAISECASLGTGYHLATLEEWQVVAREIESVDVNWSSGIIGSGFLYTGHSDTGISATAIADGHAVAGTKLLSAGDGLDNYLGTGQNSTHAWNSGKEQKRTFTLLSGEEIWDMAGNAREFVDIDGLGGTLQYTGALSANYYELNSASFSSMLATAVSSNAVALSNQLFLPTDASWNQINNKIGKIYMNANAQTLRVVTRGGNSSSGNFPGIYTADFDQAASATSSSGGFRCVAPLQ
jgi:hypothetical protein